MLKKLFYILLILYPFLVIFPLRDDTNNSFVFITALWGVLMYFIYFITLYVKIISDEKNTINIFDISALLLACTIVTSIAFSDDIVPFKFYAASKIILPYLVCSTFLVIYKPNDNLLRITFKLLKISLMIFFVLCIYKLSLIGFDIINIASYRDELWQGREHPVAFMYMGIIFSFFALSEYYSKNRLIKYILILPVFFIGVRSVFFGALIFIAYFAVISKFKKRLLILSTVIFGLSLVVFLEYSNSLEIDQQNSVMQFLSSESDIQKLERGDEIDLNSFSSGRIEILDYYISKITTKSLITGDGMSYYESTSDKPFQLHNDFFEYFFIYGILGLIVYLYSFYYNILIRYYKIVTRKKFRIIAFSIILYCIIVGYATGIDSTYIIYTIIPLIIMGKIENYNELLNLQTNNNKANE